MRFDLVDLRLFLLVAESGSITQGADRAGLALASASARIKGMEARLGVPLLERARRGVGLTPAGRALVGHAQVVGNQIEQMTGDMSAYARGLRARVRLLANTAASAELLPDVLGQFLAENDSVDVELEERSSLAIIENIASGAADLGIAASWASAGSLAQRHFWNDRLVVIASRKRSRFAKRRSVSLEDIADAPFVGLGVGSPLQEHIVRPAARRGHHLTFRVRLATLEAVCGLVGRDIGIAVVPEAAARRHAREQRLRILRLDDDLATRRLMLYARDFATLPVHARMLADALAPAAG